jgi:hypothetical protein
MSGYGVSDVLAGPNDESGLFNVDNLPCGSYILSRPVQRPTRNKGGAYETVCDSSSCPLLGGLQ